VPIRYLMEEGGRGRRKQILYEGAATWHYFNPPLIRRMCLVPYPLYCNKAIRLFSPAIHSALCNFLNRYLLHDIPRPQHGTLVQRRAKKNSKEEFHYWENMDSFTASSHTLTPGWSGTQGFATLKIRKLKDYRTGRLSLTFCHGHPGSWYYMGGWPYPASCLKGQCHEIFDFWFFS
jgi:hypothetical protein